ncbi:arsenical pump-driving ATPase [Tuwongella immobilis]|uniref:arsenite-transporting ATPase n=1 Tax=Tuwongella immobilis TaxID=692036 RepID=A0A6C2YNZ6_9BACT|nr:arsenical pump-driving ATPase [Tuwongella immobilis]VIP02853.1 arsenite-activated atpase : Uncharacterized protein OS=Sorangium cellulosum So0157-2 GN=SCE1572_04645 PE=4 SV=1: ArsA_ATPase: ArsA_ATPase [Tuwongella immobilis]VTS02647.1 arsenite-activated atpase : Uncharacterized protein OS=Sorangium cellulosum So0157-2 GN=SCE1572_04645 PE=4 SV=1: ArsA_ATPase: ArsA_ATPase [Tuwongella immobilis]
MIRSWDSLQWPALLFFTGKGGVGKTSLASATAVQLAESGRRVLLISTDPASNLDEVFGTRLTDQPTPIAGVNGLSALNLDPHAAAHRYRERMIGPVRGLLPESAIRSMEEQLSGSCTVEIAAFDAFAAFVADPQWRSQWDHLIFDTAPTGHTLRLLSLPAAWEQFLEENTTGTSCLGPLAGLTHQRELYSRTVQALADASQTVIALVTRPERSSLTEAERTRRELAELDITRVHLFVNAVFRAIDPTDSWAMALQQRGEHALAELPEGLSQLPRTELPWLAESLTGVTRLRNVGFASPQSVPAPQATSESTGGIVRNDPPVDFSSIVLGSSGVPNVILTMGKGGVGKTSVAVAIAVTLARAGHAVHLTTTDPAGRFPTEMLAGIANLRVSRIDPKVETQRYSQEVLSRASANWDETARAMLAEDLRSPCTEEIAVFRAFADCVAASQKEVLVLDTAPTGHTILLMDAALAYHREVNRTQPNLPDAVAGLLPRLRDPQQTRMILVALPEATPVHEAASLQADLERAGMHPAAWVLNGCWAARQVHDPALRHRQRLESAYWDEAARLHSRVVALPWIADPFASLDVCQSWVAEAVAVRAPETTAAV